MTEKEKMLAGQYYRPSAPELRKDREVALKNMQAFNNEDNSSKRNVILQKWFGATGKSIHMEQRFVCDYGCNIYVGENFYANFNQTFLDVCEIRIGDNCVWPKLSTPHPTPSSRSNRKKFRIRIRCPNPNRE